MKTRLLIIFAFVLFSSLFTINEADALIETLSLEDLAEKAEFVVIGEITEISPNVPWYLLFFTDGYDKFLFDVTLSVETDLDGTYGENTILFRIWDSREDFGMDIEDEQNFEIGERVLVFIGKKEPDSVMGDAYLVYGVTQGKYLLKDGIAFGTHFPEGISEDELILKIKNVRLSNNIADDKPLCDPEAELVDGLCYVIQTEKSEAMEFYSMMAIFNMSMTPVFFAASLIYWKFGKKYKKIIVPLLFATTILWILGIMTNIVPIAYA